MRELNFDIEVCSEGWTEWCHFQGDGDDASCCKTCELDDPLYIKIMKHGYVNIDLASPMSDYSCFRGSDISPLLDIPSDGQDAPEGI
jgi:hypothetical protein